jgi:hypothetical protein
VAAALDLDARREALAAVHGGALGVCGLAEVVVGSCDVAAAAARWRRLLDPIAPLEPGCWRLGRGPGLRIVRAPAERVERLVLGVRAVPQAERAWAGAAPALGGLEVAFVPV